MHKSHSGEHPTTYAQTIIHIRDGSPNNKPIILTGHQRHKFYDPIRARLVIVQNGRDSTKISEVLQRRNVFRPDRDGLAKWSGLLHGSSREIIGGIGFFGLRLPIGKHIIIERHYVIE